MKKQTLTLVTIIGFFAVIIILLLKDSEPTVTNVYCGEKSPLRQPICRVQPTPNSIDSADDVMLYYKVDDNYNYQTLLFNPEVEYQHTIIGRFEGQYLSNNKYQLNKLHVKCFGLGKVSNYYMVSKIKVKDETNANHIFFEFELSRIGDRDRSDNVDYIYGEEGHRNEDSLILDAGTLIDFEVDISNLPKDEQEKFTGGGYECNGIVIVGGGR
ncbi:hypothetical protein BFR04_06660 [Gaetbulibacter sp. 4G1]|nr:hypothetical protein [Gaetbulibacter sp. 4G1]PIA79196.1 hypothetical protein BFR04_06660 [Gaetbulibacter sp. 4G1]